MTIRANGLWLYCAAFWLSNPAYAAAAATPVNPPAAAHAIGSEVTQGIQDDGGTVPLVTGKTAILRIYFSYSGSRPLANWHGTVEISDPANHTAVDINSIHPVPISLPASTTSNLESQRISLSSGLTFILPSGLTSRGKIVISNLRTFGGQDSVPIACDNCDAWRKEVDFAPSPKLSIVLVELRYSYNGVRYLPRPIDVDYVLSYIRRLYPFGDISTEVRAVDWNPRPVFGPPTQSTFDCNHANLVLHRVRALDVAAGGNSKAHYYGMVFDGGNAVDNAFPWMRGCADVPENPDPSAVASGPTGTRNPQNWNRLPTYGDWYAAHELGHTFGRVHIGTDCGDVPNDATYPYTLPHRGEISDPQHTFVGFDLGDTDLAIAPTIFVGDQTFDAMTYCDKEWISDRNYVAILERGRAESALPAPLAIASGNSSPFNEQAGSSLDGQAGPAASQKQSTAVFPDDSANSHSMQVAQTAKMSDAVGSQAAQSGAQHPSFVSVSGTVNYTRNTATIEAVDPVGDTLDAAVTSTSSEDFAVKALDSNGRILSQKAATVFHATDIPSGHDETGTITATLPYDADISSIQIQHGDRVLAVFNPENGGFSISKPTANVPDFKKLANDPELLGLQAFAAQSGIGHFDTQMDGIIYTWDLATATPGQTLHYSVQISTDGGPWKTIAVGLSEPRIVIERKSLGQARVLEARIIAESGVNSYVVTSDSLAIYGNPGGNQ